METSSEGTLSASAVWDKASRSSVIRVERKTDWGARAEYLVLKTMSYVLSVAVWLLAVLAVVGIGRHPKRPETNAERRERELYQ